MSKQEIHTPENTIKAGDLVTFNTYSFEDAETYRGVVEYKDQLGLVVLVSGVQYEMRKVLNIRKLKNGVDMKIDVYDPLAEFAGKENAWIWIEDNSDKDEYEELDDILRFLNGEIERSELPESVRSMDGGELRKEYTRRFPIMLGKAFQSIGKSLETGEIEMEIDFTRLQCLAD